jgi:hypothetical protein
VEAAARLSHQIGGFDDLFLPSFCFDKKLNRMASIINPIQNISYNISDVPPELWAHIATFASRASLARLCSASHEFYSKFSPLLYGDIIDPPLTAAQSSSLLETLSNVETSSFRQPHVAAKIQQLSLTDRGGLVDRNVDTIKARVRAATDSLRNMYRPIPGAESVNGSVLRVLHWQLAAGMDELGVILGTRGHFPNLKELVVSTTGTNNNFNVRLSFILPIECSLIPSSFKSEGSKYWELR